MRTVIARDLMLGGHGHLLLVERFGIRDGQTLNRRRWRELNEGAKLIAVEQPVR
jgi:hypothetical protein